MIGKTHSPVVGWGRAEKGFGTEVKQKIKDNVIKLWVWGAETWSQLLGRTFICSYLLGTL